MKNERGINYLASFFFLIEFKYIKKIIHMSTCIRKYIFLISNSTTEKKLPFVGINGHLYFIRTYIYILVDLCVFLKTKTSHSGK